MEDMLSKNKKAIVRPYKRQPHKMVKHTQTIRRQMVKHIQQFIGKLPANCLSMFCDFVALALKRLKNKRYITLRIFTGRKAVRQSRIPFCKKPR